MGNIWMQAAELLRQLTFWVGYVSRGDSFPQPLSRKRETEVIARMLDGDEAARDALVEHNLRLVAHIAKKYRGSGRDTDDLVSIGTIGLIKAVNTFRPEKCPALGSYAARCVENEIRMHLRATKKLKNEVSLESPIGTDPVGNTVALMDILGTDDDAVADEVGTRMELDALSDVLESCLDARELAVIRMRYGLDGGEALPQWDIAGQLGISRSYVSRIEKRALEKLREHMIP